MAVEKLHFHYKIKDIEGYKDIVKLYKSKGFGNSSLSTCNIDDALEFGFLNGGRLQTARDAAVFRAAADGADNADDYQITCTAGIFCADKGAFVYAFDDDLFYALHDAKLSLTGKMKVNELIAYAIVRARTKNRVAPALAECPLELRVAAKCGKSDFGQHVLSRAVLQEASELYAGSIAGTNKSSGKIIAWTEQALISEGVDSDNVFVWPVGLGRADSCAFDVDVNRLVTGFARGMYKS